MTMHVRGRLMRTGAGLAFERKDAGGEPSLAEINEAVKKLM